MIADTTLLVDLARGDPGARAFMEALEKGSESIRVASPAVAKFWEALERSRQRPRQQDRIRTILTTAPEIAFNADHAVAAGRILASRAEAGDSMDPIDAMVAAIAIVEDDALVTRNARDFERIAELRVRTY